MTLFLWLIAATALMFGAAWVVRRGGQMATGNAPYFRDMPFAASFGYVVGGVFVLLIVIGYLRAYSDNAITANTYFYVWVIVTGFIVFAIAAWVFRLLGRSVGTKGSRKLFRQMPLTAAFGILIIAIYAFVSVFAGFLAPHGQEEILRGVASNIAPGGNPELGGNPAVPLGTDQLGRDILSRLLYGAQNTVGIAFLTTLLAFFIGGSLGLLAAVVGGWVDQLLSRAVDAMMAIPSLIFSLLLMTIALVWAAGNTVFITVAMVIIIAVIDSTRVFRLARAVGQGIVVMDYIEAAKLRGESMSYLVFKEILPNATAPLLAEFGLRFCFVFLTIASLSFLGVGIQQPLADWGTMVRDAAPFINNLSIVSQEWAQDLPDEVLYPMFRQASLPLLPAAAIALLTVAVNFVVDWMLHRSSGLKE